MVYRANFARNNLAHFLKKYKGSAGCPRGPSELQLGPRAPSPGPRARAPGPACDPPTPEVGVGDSKRAP